MPTVARSTTSQLTPPPLLTIKQAADFLNVHPRTVVRYIERGQLAAFHIAGDQNVPLRVVGAHVARLLRPANSAEVGEQA